MNYDNTDKTAFLAIMGLTVLMGVIVYYVFAMVTPKSGVADLDIPNRSSDHHKLLQQIKLLLQRQLMNQSLLKKFQ